MSGNRFALHGRTIGLTRRRDAPKEDDGTGSPDGRLALVLSGGGSKGALQVGMYRALCEVGLEPDFIVGTSVGALNGASIAGGVGPRALARGWRDLSRSDLFHFNWSLLWKGLSSESLFRRRPFRRFLEERLPVRRFRELDTPLHVVSTHLSMGTPCHWSDDDLVEAVLASCSVPGLLPPVYAHDGVAHVDGSLGDNLPLEMARELGAERIIAMTARTCDRCEADHVAIGDVIGRAFSIAADCSLRRMAEDVRDDSSLLLLQPDLGEQVYALDFSQSARLIEAGYEHALPRLRRWAREGSPA